MKAFEKYLCSVPGDESPRTESTLEAAECDKSIQTEKSFYPYHYRGSKLEEFSNALKDTPRSGSADSQARKASSSANFIPWILGIAGANPHNLKPALLLRLHYRGKLSFDSYFSSKISGAGSGG